MTLATLCCGVDEAGRGPLAGPVYASAVVLGDGASRINGINDSKKLTAAKREALAPLIQAHASAWAIASASAEEVDRINILQATMLAMFRAISQLPAGSFTRIVIDGTQIPRDLRPWAAERGIEVVAQPRADADVLDVGAASILAKTARDTYMMDVHHRHPQYGFDAHKGYGTAQHMAALTAHGPCPEHRKTFAPVAQWSLL
ncbi:MAG TPA: ribonuclease HII [Casimicrobium sp.]|nr:ribonuclease HII [Casimicrobium sp.]